jgi:superfamily II RNA helicase
MPGAPTTFRGKALFPFQARAAEAIHDGKSVLVAAPTGAGKTLVADFAISRALSEGRRVVYTSPIKALSNQKFRDFRADYGEDRVGIMTGDVSMRPEAPLVVMTTEIFRNTVFEDPARLDAFDFAIFDEVHYLDDPERGTVWEESILYAPPHVKIVALSATVPNVAELAAWIGHVRDVPVEVVVETERPVPLVHKVWVPGKGPRGLDELQRHQTLVWDGYRTRKGREKRARPEEIQEEATSSLLRHLADRDLLPALYFVFSRRDCEHLARRHGGMDLLTEEGREEILAIFDDLAKRYEVADAPRTRELRRLASRGVLYHHAGMLPIDKEIVERLFTTGRVRLLFATETFALGVNMPARTVCFHTLTKFDGTDVRILSTRDYWQMAGRAGRQGIDRVGHVFAILSDRRVGRRDVERLQSGVSEPVRSRFNLDYSSILNLYSRIGDRVADAWRRSFARWHAAHARRGKPPPDDGPSSPSGRAIRARLEVLREFHHLDDQGLTRKGRLTSRINGYEIACAEAYETGVLARCDSLQAAVLFASIAYEARPSDEADPPVKDVRRVAEPFERKIDAFRRAEKREGVPDPVRPPEFLIAGVAEAWAEGEDMAVLESMCNLAPGDLVRVFRMTIQLLRQTLHAIPPKDPVRETLQEAIERLNRDVVDARRQLELG